MKTTYDTDSHGIAIIENTILDQNKYGHLCGSEHILITDKHIKALKEGKQLAFNDGEYCTFLSMSVPNGQ